MRHKSLFAACAAGALLFVAGSAAAQEYSRLVVFGDSLSDSGNFFASSGGAQPPSPPYAGKFSNGPVFTEQFGFTLALSPAITGSATGSVNNAFGFARTDVDVPGGQTPDVPTLPEQLAAYRAVGGTFGSKDLVSLYGGANNILEYFQAPLPADPLTGAQAVGTAAANDIGALSRTIASLGAGTVIVPNLPAIGLTPSFNTSPARPLADAATGAYNATLAGQIAASSVAFRGTNFILVDVARGFQEIVSNPGAFGFSNITQSCLNSTTGAVCATPDSFLFFDGVHPTAAGHRFLAALVTDYVFYGDRGAASAAMADVALDHRQQALERAHDRLEAGDLSSGESVVSVMVDGQDWTRDARGVFPQGEVNTASVRISAEHGFGAAMRAGLLLSVSDSTAQAGPLGFEARTFSADAFVGWRGPAAFVSLAGGLGFDEYDGIERVNGLGTAVNRGSRSDGVSTGARLQAGVWIGAAGVRFSPRAAVNALASNTDGYQEAGAAARHRVEERGITGINGEIAVRAETGAPFGLNAFAEVGWRQWVGSNYDPVRVSLVDNTARELSVAVPKPEGGLLLDLGVSGDVSQRLTIGATYRGRHGDSSQSHAALISVSMRY